jgi:hypothetical protein
MTPHVRQPRAAPGGNEALHTNRPHHPEPDAEPIADSNSAVLRTHGSPLTTGTRLCPPAPPRASAPTPHALRAGRPTPPPAPQKPCRTDDTAPSAATDARNYAVFALRTTRRVIRSPPVAATVDAPQTKERYDTPQTHHVPRHRSGERRRQWVLAHLGVQRPRVTGPLA